MAKAKLLKRPVVEAMPDRRIAGLLRRYTLETRFKIPQQWDDYNASAKTPGKEPDGWYGVCRDEDAGFCYLCGIEGKPAKGQGEITLPAGRWARFATTAHLSRMGDVWEELHRDWMGRPDLPQRDGPLVEFYPPAFNGKTGEGGFEIWVPLADEREGGSAPGLTASPGVAGPKKS